MSTKLAGSFSFAAIAVAMLVAQFVDSEAHQSTATTLQHHVVAIQPVADEANTLAFSSIFPAFVPHKLPVANMADVAADAAIQERAPQVDSVERFIETDQENSSEDAVKRRLAPASVTPALRADAVNPPSPLRSDVDVAFWKQAYANYSSNRGAAMAPFVAGLPAIRTQLQSGSVDKSVESFPLARSYTQSSPFLKVSTAHSHLQDFKAMLRPDGFERADWQDMSFEADLGTEKSDIEPFIVMIDPGHGGTDQGSKGHNGLLEKDLTLDIARRVRLFLTEFEHIDVRLTRHHDHGLSRQSRVAAITRSEADMVISLHFNHLPQTDINLVESYYAGRQNIEQSLSAQKETPHGELHRTGSSMVDVDLGFTDGSARLAKTLQQHVYSEVSFGNDTVQNAGVKQETLFVLTRSFTPSALIEISCLSHAGEAERLVNDDYRNRLAAALVDGIRNYHDSLQRAPLTKRGDIGA